VLLVKELAIFLAERVDFAIKMTKMFVMILQEKALLLLTTLQRLDILSQACLTVSERHETGPNLGNLRHGHARCIHLLTCDRRIGCHRDLLAYFIVQVMRQGELRGRVQECQWLIATAPK